MDFVIKYFESVSIMNSLKSNVIKKMTQDLKISSLWKHFPKPLSCVFLSGSTSGEPATHFLVVSSAQ